MRVRRPIRGTPNAASEPALVLVQLFKGIDPALGLFSLAARATVVDISLVTAIHPAPGERRCSVGARLPAEGLVSPLNFAAPLAVQGSALCNRLRLHGNMRYADQTAPRARELVDDRGPRANALSMQLRAFDAIPQRRQPGAGCFLHPLQGAPSDELKGELVAVGGPNLGGGIDPVYNAVGLAKLAMEKGAVTLLMQASARKQLFDLPDEMATNVTIQF